MSYELSKQEITREIVKCGKDPAYFLDNYARIVHQERGIIPFKTYNFQKTLLKDFHDYRYNIILKGRQLGISTIVSGYISWMMLFYKEKNILVMATKLHTAIEIVDKVRDIIQSVPDWLKIATVKTNNKTKFELSNGSKIQGTPTSKDAGRGQALSLLVIDEAAHVDDMDELWTGLYPTVSTGGRCIALSTPNGVGNWFHKTYVEAESHANNFKCSKLPWNVHPEYDDAWFKNMTKNMSSRDIAQEYECNFNASGETVIAPHDLESLKKLVKEAKLLFDTGREYGNCMIVVENNNVGFAVLTKLIEMSYPNIYYSTKGSGDFLDSTEASYTSNSVPGFSTTMKSRPLIIAKLEEFVRNKLLKINSQRLINELDTFIWHNGKPEAQKGYNDDLVMAMAIACWVRDTALINNDRNLEYSKVFLNSIFTSRNTFNSSIQGMRGYEKSQDMSKQAEVYKNYSWVIKG